MDRFARSSEVLTRDGVGGGVGGTAASDVRFVEGMGGEELLVVHVSVTPEAMRNRAFDTTLLNNRIEVESESEALADKSADDQEVEVVVVEAAPAQVAATLAEIKQDQKNYVAIEVNEPMARVRTRALNSKAAQLQADLQQYNRGRVLNQQQVQLSPDNRNYYFTPQQQNFAYQQPKLSESLAKSNDAAQEATTQPMGDSQLGVATSSSERQSAPQTLAIGRDALDVSAAEVPAAPGVASGQVQHFRGESWDYGYGAQNVARRASQKLAAKTDMLQVLFVLQSDQQSSAAATSSGPLPAIEPGPTSAHETTIAPASGAPSVPTQEEGLKDSER